MKTFFGAVLVMLLFTFWALIMVEWFVGCGEVWIQADGSRVVGECVFIGR